MFAQLLERLGITATSSGVYAGGWNAAPSGGLLTSYNPATTEPIATVKTASRSEYDRCVETAEATFLRWRSLPPPHRGEIIRQFGQALREQKADLGLLVTLETGKIRAEGEGEVQEMIDMCDFAVGLSRQIYGLTIATERSEHRMFEQWHPLGTLGIITAFNFPVAVWAWNAAIAAVCGDTMIWKPSARTPLTAIAVQQLAGRIAAKHGFDGLFNLCIGEGIEVGQWMAEDARLPLISATGSCAMGREVATRVAARLGRSLLELGGNNGVIVTESANIELALRAVTFAAVGTAGQRCTTLRRLFLHRKIAKPFLARLIDIYGKITIGNPWEDGVLVGPLISEQAVEQMQAAIETAIHQGGRVLCGGKRLARKGHFVEPAIIEATPSMPIVAQETFAPILYVVTFDELADAIHWNNSVSQGLSSAIFSDSIRETERFLGPAGSDCGIANVNIGTSGAEIGGAFGGEKDTGGGREAGSDAWKQYMRRQTCTINFGSELPLAQGIQFGLPGS